MPTTYRATEYVSGSSRLAFGREDNFSVAAQPTRRLGITNQGFDFPDKRTDVRQYRDFGSGPQYFQSRFGKNEYGSSISFLPTTAEMFYYPMGQDSTVDSDVASPDTSQRVAGTQLHVMEPLVGAQLPGLTLWAGLTGQPNFTRSAPGTVITGFSASLAETSELTVSMPMMSRFSSTATSTLGDPFPQPKLDGNASGGVPTPYMFYDRTALIQVMGSYAGPGLPLAGGRTFSRVRNFNLNFSRQVEPIYGFLDGTTPTSPANSLPDNPRNPLTFVAGAAETTLSLEVTPAGITQTAGADAVYDILQQEITGDIVVPFRRVRVSNNITYTDTLDFVFLDCKLGTAPHSFPESRGTVTVPMNVTVNKFKIVSQDGLANYGSLT